MEFAWILAHVGNSGNERLIGSSLQGQRLQQQNSMLMHIYPSWIIHKLSTHASVPWTQHCLQDSKVQGHSSKVKGPRTKCLCPCSSTLHGWSPYPLWVRSLVYFSHSTVHKYLSTNRWTDEGTDRQCDYYMIV